MAYGNWGAFVYKNDERQKNREDNTPYSEDELRPGYYQAFGGNDKEGNRLSTGKKLSCMHGEDIQTGVVGFGKTKGVAIASYCNAVGIDFIQQYAIRELFGLKMS